MTAASAPTTRQGGRKRRFPSIVAALAAALVTLASLGGTVALATDPPVSQPPASRSDKPPRSGARQDGQVPRISSAEQRVENVITASRQYLGIAYRVGSEGPSLFDCSGLVFRAFSDAGLVDRISGSRLRAAGYMRWFARQGLMTANEEQAQRGDLVVYNRGKHIGIYLGDGRTISALLSGVTVHGLHGISQEVTGFLRPDWSGKGEVPPFVPMELPDVAEEPAVLVPTSDWLPTLDNTTITPVEREGVERADLRTPTSRTYENRDGTFTTEFHAQPIHFLPADADELQPIDLRFVLDEKTGAASVTKSPVIVSTRRADARAGLVSAVAAEHAVTLRLLRRSQAQPTLAGDGAAVDYFDLLSEGTGLRVLARPDGFKSFVVLSDEPDSNRFSFMLEAPGLAATLDELTGDVTLVDEAGTVMARLARPLLLDSSDGDGLGGGLYTVASSYELATDEDGRTILTVAVRQRLLEEAVYPAYVDISLTGFPAATAPADVTFASSHHSDATLAGYQRPDALGFGELWLGHQPRSRNDNEVFLRFNELAATLGTVDVATAVLELLPYWQRADDVAALVRRVSAEWSSETLTWNTRPLANADLGELAGAAGQWASLDVSAYVTDIISRGAADFGLMLYGAEDASGTWKRLVASDGADRAEIGPRLTVTWSGLRPSVAVAQPIEPGIPQVPEKDANPDEALPPAFAWTLPTIAAEQTRFQVQVSADGFATLAAESGTVKGRDGKLDRWSLPADALSANGDYEWRVRVRFGEDGWSAWSVPEPFTWSAAQPAVPAVVPNGAMAQAL